MTNQHGVSREDNDRLLELMGECRHEWWDESHGCIVSGPEPWLTHGCNKCAKVLMDSRTCTYPLPAVGDGHDVTLGEMMRLVRQLWPQPADRGFNTERITVYLCANGGYRMVVTTGETSTAWGDGLGDTPEAALCAAILAAVDKE